MLVAAEQTIPYYIFRKTAIHDAFNFVRYYENPPPPPIALFYDIMN